MVRARYNALGERPYSRRGRRTRLFWVGLLLSVVVAVPALWTAVLVGAATLLPVDVSVHGASDEVSPHAPVTISTAILGSSVESVALHESIRDVDGSVVAERWIPVEAHARDNGIASWLTPELRVRHVNGSNPLTYDGVYRLTVAVNRKEAAFPVPKDELRIHEYSFSTLTSPQVHLPEDVVHLRYQEHLSVRWNSPLESFSVQTVPPVAVRSSIDQTNASVGYVELPNAKPGARYQVRIVEARGTNGAPLVAPVALTVETAAPPALIDGAVRIENGERIVLHWNRGVVDVEYEIVPAVGSAAMVDPADPRISYIELRNPEQGKEYQVSIIGGAGTNGAPLTTMHAFTVTTPFPLEVAKISPVHRAYGVSLTAPISVTFSEAIGDRGAAEAAITIWPTVAGSFTWPAPNRVEFVPRSGLPELTDITVQIRGGPDGARGVSGSYLEEPFEYEFLTQPNKLIDVDLTRQRLTLYEEGRAVFTTLVATGVRFAETPTGTYMVNFKLPSTRMRGVNPSGLRYDIPNVPWVMSFLGDYTFHAAPWRSTFGYPQSNGCVSMSTAAAKFVYDWSPVGTPVKIYY